jgi:hypothetical protein
VRELRYEGEGKDEQRKETQPVTPGQTQQENRDRGTEGPREQGREHPGKSVTGPVSDEAGGVLESSLTWCHRHSLHKACAPTADPRSTPFGAEDAPNSAQDDTIRFASDFRGDGAVFQGDFARSGVGSALRAWERSKVWIA